MTKPTALRPVLAAISALLLGILVPTAPATAQVYTYAVEINDTLCGYADLKISTEGSGADAQLLVTERVVVTVTALGSEVHTEVDSEYRADPESGRLTAYVSRVHQGDTEFELRASITGDVARIVDSLSNREKTVRLPPGAILENPARAPHLVRDLIEGGAATVTYPILDFREAEVQDTTYTRRGAERLTLAGREIDTIIVDRLTQPTGLVMRQWLDRNGMVVKLEVAGRSIYLADPAVRNRLAIADLDPSILQKVGVAIADVHGIEFMRVRAVIEPTGLRVSAADLNVPGQRFAGTVEGNRVEGIFTVEHARYLGAAAPPFPPRPDADSALIPFLRPEDLIESDDPVLVEHARSVTAGAKDSWEAAVRLSGWVADNISYAIPGGVGARKTFDVRAGECGAHSLLLAALCRAVGIPARVVWGCMYVPNQGGAFGQHAWNEVHMGDAGWVPVDSTAFEVAFVDSAHLRIGVYESYATAINMKVMEILEHRVTAVDADAESLEAFEPYVGEYAHPAGKKPFEVRVRNGALALQIPDGPTLALVGADARERWYAKLSNRLYCAFPRDANGAIAALTLHEILRLPRRADPDTVPADVPAELRPCLGTYRLAAVNADFEVLFDAKGLAVHDPLEDRVVHFEPTGEEGHWVDEFDKNVIAFERNAAGAVIALVLDSANRFPRERRTLESAPSPAAHAVAAMLTDYHRAAAAADGERFFGHLDADAVVIGTDRGERWTVEGLKAIASPLFAAGTGWTTLPTAQHVYLSDDGHLAWFDESLESTRFGVMRGSGVARERDGRWRIVQYHTALPVPNAMFADLMAEIARLPAQEAPAAVVDEPTGPVAEVRAVLLAFHRAASMADHTGYFALLAQDAIHLGTAADERFDRERLRGFLEPYFGAARGRERSSLQMRVNVAESGHLAWFDDLLQYGDFGVLRCTGVLVLRDGGWRIVQYHLAVPVPNRLVPDLVERIGAARR